MPRLTHLIAVALAAFTLIAVPTSFRPELDPGAISPRQDLRGERALDPDRPLHLTWSLRPGP